MYIGKIEKYVFNNLLAFDRQLNALLGGDPEMTISGRMGRSIRLGHCYLCRPVCWVLNKLFKQKDHCGQTATDEAAEGSDAVIT